tara:strand:+ start:456 stop:929 length:474 start_codon:yes stop_codon:yes gene_type:complete
MKIYLFLILLFILSNCTLNKVVQHQGVHNLNTKQLKLKINHSNKNDIIKSIGPPSSKSTFENDVYIYIERKTSNSKLMKFGNKNVIANNVLILEINSKGILISKKFYNKNDMQKINFDETTTSANYSKRSFVYNFLASLRQKIDDPTGKKRAKVTQQ